ncbi:MAG: UDP-N-acetylmuramate dehydrogenase [Defluviitaleaceae bacterium]|nr:UDP-N-acetylmuramate dehydrogenase [Defluviitaleaceae bacterium]
MTPIKLIESLQVDFLTDEPMSRHTSFKIGGPADILAMPKTSDELIKIWNTCKSQNIPITILGDGANVLVADTGIRGVVVFTNKMNDMEILEGEKIRAQSGARLSALAEKACKSTLAGLAFASGIPGTVGGAIYMNAGAYGHDIKDFCESVTLFANGEVVTKTNAEMQFGYRKSLAQTGEMLILDATFQLSQGDTDQIREEMKDLNARRRKTQPLEYHSAGSFFKRPEGHFAGKLIQDSGLKGFAVNDAQVSEKHAGFVVNKGSATAADVLALMQHVQQKVYNDFKVHLEPEVRILGL